MLNEELTIDSVFKEEEAFGDGGFLFLAHLFYNDVIRKIHQKCPNLFVGHFSQSIDIGLHLVLVFFIGLTRLIVNQINSIGKLGITVKANDFIFGLGILNTTLTCAW